MRHKKLLVLVLLVLCIGAFFAFDLGRFLTLEQVQRSQEAFQAALQRRPLAVTLLFMGVYVAVTAVSLPGASVLTLAAGAGFGLVWGTLVVSFASTAGATLAMLAARTVLRDTMERRFHTQLAEVNRGIARDGALYLFTLRLIPAIPFFVVNIVLGLTRIRVRTYCWVSQLGMLPATVVYVYAGTQIARIESLRSVLSPGLLGAFVLLGLLPLATRAIMRAVARRKVYARWKGQRPARFESDLLVIGAGSGGLVSALIGAAVKARVTLVEGHRMGGDCLNFGCVPSKALIRSARLQHEIRHAARYGLAHAEARIDFRALMARVHAVIAEVAPHDSEQRYAGMGVDVLRGHARIVNPWTVEVALADGSMRTVTTRNIVLACGARPVVPPLPGIEDARPVTSDTVWEAFAQLDEMPARLVVLGGGPVGCELAQAFARLGAQVSLVEMADRLMLREDPEVSAFARACLEADGVRVLTRHQALRCEVDAAGGKSIVVAHEGREVRIAFDQLLSAAGRAARLTGYGLEALGVETGKTVLTNAYLQTNYPNIYAVGDVAGPYQFTHTAAHQAWFATVNALFGGFHRFKVDYRVVPWCTFIDPEVARVGLNEQEARAQKVDYEVLRYDLGDLDRAIAESEASGFVKVLTVPGRDRILGVTIVGSHAGDLLAQFVLAMKHGLGLKKILGTIHSYPTWAEAAKGAAGQWRRAHQPLKLLEWLRRYHAWRRG